MSADTPRVGDTVRVVFVGAVQKVDDQGRVQLVATPNGQHPRGHYVPADATVEVLERADDPSKDPVGTVRREDHEGGYSLYQCVIVPSNPKWTRWMCTYSTAHGNFGCHLAHENVVGTPVIGVVPGTPAAEAADGPFAHVEPDCGCDDPNVVRCRGPRPSVRVPNEPHGIPNEARQNIADKLVAGDKAGAVRELRQHVSIGIRAAVSYVESMSEYQTYLATQAATDVDPSEADRMRAAGFDRQPEFTLTDQQRAQIGDVLKQRQREFSWRGHDGETTLDDSALAGVVADIVFAAIRRDRERRAS